MRRIDVRRVVGVHRRGAAAEDERVRIARAHRLRRDRVRDELRVDAALAHAARDQLRVLAAEVDHQHRPVLRPAGNWTTFDGSAAIVRRLFRDRHVVRVRLAQAGRRDADEARASSSRRSSPRRSSPSTAAGRRRAGARSARAGPCTDASLDPLGHELLDVLDVALEVAVLRERPRAFIAPSEPMPRYSLKRSPWWTIDLARRLVGAGEQRAEP